MLALFPGGTRVAAGVLELDGMPVTELAERFGTPLVVYAEDALRERARMFQRAVPDALVVYGTKAFPNVALMRLLAEEGLGADVSTLGELAFAPPGRDRGRPAARAREQQVGRGAARRGRAPARSSSSTRSTSPARAAAAGVRRVLVRVTPGVEAETHEAIRTGHRGSKFGLDEDDAVEAVRAALAAGLDVEGLHVHVGSQLADVRAHLLAVALLGRVRRPLPDRARLAAADDRRRRRLRDPARRGGAGAAGRGARAHGRGRGLARVADARAGRAAPDRRAGPLARRADGVHALPRRRGQAGGRPPLRRDRRRHVRQPAAAALPGALHGRCSRTGPTRSPTASSRSPASTASRATC